MKIEHFAMNVENPPAMADWYRKNLGLSVVRQSENAPYTTFLADNSGQVMIEIYNNPADEVPDYRAMNPLIVHLAFVSADPAMDKKRLLEAGAKEESDARPDDGSHIVMLRDPWGMCIQLCKRGTPMLVNVEKR